MGLRANTQWNRVTVQKAKATIVSPAETDAPDGGYRRVRLVMRSGIAAFAIFDDGIDANKAIASSRSWEWAEADAGVALPHFDLLPGQVLWAMAANNLAQANGVAMLSVIVEFRDGGQ